MLTLPTDELWLLACACDARSRTALKCTSNATRTAFQTAFDRVDANKRRELQRVVALLLDNHMPGIFERRGALYELFGRGINPDQSHQALQVFDAVMPLCLKYAAMERRFTSGCANRVKRKRNETMLREYSIDFNKRLDLTHGSSFAYVSAWLEMVSAVVEFRIAHHCDAMFKWLKTTRMPHRPAHSFDYLRRHMRSNVAKGVCRIEEAPPVWQLPRSPGHSGLRLFTQALLHVAESVDGECESGDCEPYAHSLRLVWVE